VGAVLHHIVLCLENVGVDVDTLTRLSQHQEPSRRISPGRPAALRHSRTLRAGAIRAVRPRTPVCPICCPAAGRGIFGYQGLFGHEYVAPIIVPNGPLLDLSGNPINGFPGFDGMTPNVSLICRLNAGARKPTDYM